MRQLRTATAAMNCTVRRWQHFDREWAAATPFLSAAADVAVASGRHPRRRAVVQREHLAVGAR